MKKSIIALLLCIIIISNGNITVNAATVALVGITDDGHDHTSYFNSINSNLNKMGYSNSKIAKYIDPKKSTVMNALDTCEIIVTRSHGGAFQDNNGNYIGNYIQLKNSSIFNSDIEDLSKNSLSNAKLIVYIGCLTAAGGISKGTERNLVVASEVKGAETALGFSKSIGCKGANTWVNYFFKYLADGENIDRAANIAVEDTKEELSSLEALGQLNIDSMLYRGKWNTTFPN